MELGPARLARAPFAAPSRGLFQIDAQGANVSGLEREYHRLGFEPRLAEAEATLTRVEQKIDPEPTTHCDAALGLELDQCPKHVGLHRDPRDAAGDRLQLARREQQARLRHAPDTLRQETLESVGGTSAIANIAFESPDLEQQ